MLSVLNAAQVALEAVDGPAVNAPANRAPNIQNVHIHESAYVDEPSDIGDGTRIWHFTHILKNVRIGRNCSIGQNVSIGPKVTVGDNCKIQNNVSLYEGVTLEDGVFCGPSCVFTNVVNPRAEIERKSEFKPTLVRHGVTIGANATILCGHILEPYCFIAAGATPYVFTLENRGPLADQLEAAGVPVKVSWFSLAAGCSGKAVRILRMAPVSLQLFLHFLFRRPDIIHFFLPADYLIGAPIALLTGHRRCVMSRRSMNNYQDKFPRILAVLERHLHKRMRAILGNSKKVVSQLVSEEGAPVDRTILIYNGVQPGDIHDRKKIRATLGIPEQTVVIIVVANLIPYKGHDDLLEACGRLSPHDDWKLLVVGSDVRGNRSRLEAQAERLGIADRVDFTGGRADVRALLASSDIGVLASHEEGFSNAILEGMAEGLPMVVTDVGGNAEAVIDSETGIVVPPRNPEAMANALSRFIGDPELRTKMGQAGSHRIGQNFTLSACVDNYERLYEAILAGRPMGPLADVQGRSLGLTS